jgi:serine/threonine protein kinase
VGTLGNPSQSKARVWASKITAEKHGFTDTIADKIVRIKTAQEKEAARKEVRNLQKLQHNHIVAFLGYYTKGDHLGILMFPVALWDLNMFLESPDVEEHVEMMRPWFGCLTRTLLFLHTRPRPIKHRDIKPANILIDCKGAVFLTDFGISKEYNSAQAAVTHSNSGFTVKYASPAMVKQADQGVESDIFSLGCVFLEMATVILRKDLDQLYRCISECTGYGDTVEYHRDYMHAYTWIERLQEQVENDDCYNKPYQRHLIKKGLPMIARMMHDSASAPMVRLEDVSLAMDPISPEKCASCIAPVSPFHLACYQYTEINLKAPQPSIPEDSRVDYESGRFEFLDSEATISGPSTRTNVKKSSTLNVPKGSHNKLQLRKNSNLQNSDDFIPESAIIVRNLGLLQLTAFG